MPTTQVNHKKAVRDYLSAIASTAGPVPHAMRRSQDWYQEEINKLTERYSETEGVMERLMISKRIVELEASAKAKADWDASRTDPAEFEEAFIASAETFARARKVPYEAFRAMGVTPDVLKRAKVPKLKDL